jgi:hypothetical protein
VTIRRPSLPHVRAAPSPLAPADASVLGPQLKLWLRSDVGVTVSSGKVTQWDDQSGNGANFVQGTDAIRPVYTAANGSFAGKPSLDFTAVGAVLTCASTLVLKHLIVVANHPNALFPDNDSLVTNGDAFFRGTTGSPNWLADNGLFAGLMSRDGSPTRAALDVANRPHVYDIAFYSAMSSSTYVIGDDAGGGDTWRGSVVEVIGSSVTIPARMLAAIRLGLKRRYGTP